MTAAGARPTHTGQTPTGQSRSVPTRPEPTRPEPTSSGPTPTGVATGAALVGGGAAGFAALAVLGLSPALAGAVGAVAAVAVWCAVARPVAMLVLAVVAEVVNLPGVAAGLGVPGVFQALLLLVTVALLSALRNEEARARISRPAWWFTALLLVYLASQALSFLVTTDLAATVTTVDRRAVDVLVVVVVLLLTVATDSVWRVAAAVAAPLAVLAALTVVNLALTGGTWDMLGFSVVTQASGELTTTVRFGGPLPDSNFWGRHLVIGLPLAVALALRAHRHRHRAATSGWVAAVIALLAGMYLTQSRGTYLAAAVGIAVFLVLADRAVRLRGLWLVPVGVGLALLPGIGERFLSLVEDLGSDATTGVDPSVLGRSAALEIAWQMFIERPLTGYGAGSYAGLVIEYADRVPTPVADPTDATHNLYAELAAETGVLGLLGWAVLVTGIGGLVLHRLLTTRDLDQRRLAAAVLAGLVAWSIASVFLHLAYFRTFGLLAVLAAALCCRPEPHPRRIDGPRTLRRLAGAGAVVALAGLAAAGTASALATDRARATTQLVVTPRSTPGTLSAWPMDVRSREIVMPTLAALVDPGTPDTRYRGDPVRGLVTVDATAADPDAARALLVAAEGTARARLEELGLTSTFRVVALGDPAVTPERHLTPAALAACAAAAAGAGALGWIVVRRRTPTPAAPLPPQPRSTT